MAESPRPEQEQQPTPDGPDQEPSGPRGFTLRDLLRPIPLVTLGLGAVLAALLCVYFLSGPAGPVSPDGEIAAPLLDSSVVRTRADLLGSEIYSAGTLEADVRTVDLALLAGLHTLGVDPAGIEFVDVRRGSHAGETFTVQTLRLPEGVSALQLLKALRANLPEGRFQVVLGDKGEVSVSVGGVLTHRFVNVPPPYRPSARGPKLVIVIDDMGENMTVAHALAALPVPVVFAVWPNASQVAEVRALARKRGLDLLVHLPMEPISYPKDKPGKEALFVSMSDEAIDATIKANLDKVPEAVGVNNHMGSRFTADARGMGWLMQALKRRGLFFLDSKTTGKSVGRATAGAVDLPFFSRDVFLDNSLAVPDIVLQLKKAERLAMRNGSAIAIGHPHPETARALAQWLRGLDPSVSIVPLTALAPR